MACCSPTWIKDPDPISPKIGHLIFGEIGLRFLQSSQMPSPHILVVCTANICRSPVGEILLKTKLDSADLSDWTVSSAGTWAESGDPAARFSSVLMAERGLNIRSHRSQPTSEEVVQQADLILCMETNHLRQLQKKFPVYKHRIYTIRQMVNKRGSVRDPYGGSQEAYAQMVAELDDLIERGFPRIQALTWENYQRRSNDGSN